MVDFLKVENYRLKPEYFVELQATFEQQNPCWLLIGRAIFISIIGIVGIVLNSALIFITFRTKELRGTANFLLALTAFCEFLHQIIHFQVAFLTFSGIKFIRLRLAVHICMVPLLGFCAIPLLMFFTGLDRFIQIVFPTFHERVNMKIYLATFALIATMFSIFNVFLVYKSAMEFPVDINITGSVGELFQGQSGIFNVETSIIFNFATILIYIIVGIIFRKYAVSSGAHNIASKSRRIYRSLLIVISMNIGGYFFMYSYYVANYIARDLFKTAEAFWLGSQILAIPLNVSASSNAPILYWTSTDYRRAFKREFFGIFTSNYGSSNRIDTRNGRNIVVQNGLVKY